MTQAAQLTSQQTPEQTPQQTPQQTVVIDVHPSDTEAPVAPPPAARRGPVQRTLHDSAYALLAFPLALTAFCVVLTLTTVGVVLGFFMGGMFILVLAAYVARGFAGLERARLGALRGGPA